MMSLTTSRLLALATAAALASTAMAQIPNDDCAGAIPVTTGLNGPFSTVGATTSSTWPCAAGGNDIWFSFTPTTSANYQFNTCSPTRSYDTAIEVFDGTAGCGSLVSLGCNDDSCGLGSALTVPVVAGTTYYVRVGGFSSQTGSFDLTIGLPSSVTSYGTGCVARTDSLYENFTTSASFDLAGGSISWLRAGSSVVAQGGAVAYVAPSPAATALTLTDDSEATVTLSAPFPYGAASSTTSLVVCSNGFVSVATGNGTPFSPAVAGFLNASQAAWRSWHDYNPGRAGSGAVKFEEIGGVAYVTWDGVLDFSTASTTPSTFQFQFELASGNVHMVWVSMSGGGNGHLVGYSPGGSSVDGGSTDLSTSLPVVVSGTNIAPLRLAAAAGSLPIAGSTMSIDTSNIPATAPFGAVLLSITQFNPGIDLTGLGMAGCSQYQGGEVTLLFLPAGAPTLATTFTVPAAVGLHIYGQSFVYDPAGGLTVLGAIASNGLDMAIGSF